MKINRKVVIVSFLASALILGFLLAGPDGFAGGGPVGAQQQSQFVLTRPAPEHEGFFSWLTSLLPRGLRFTGPAIRSSNQPTVLATTNCFDSGASVSCNGFHDMEEYLSAVRASQNLGIPFEQLKTKVQRGMPLHEAIHELRPSANSQLEALRAEQEAQAILKDFSS